MAVFDGHGGVSAAKWCGEHFGACLSEALKEYKEDVREAFNAAYTAADSQLTGENDIYSGCTAATCLLKPSGDGYMLCSANCGDARAVLWYFNVNIFSRKGEAVRLTYDHKGSDPAEQKRVKEAGGFIADNRVSGMLAITRSLGDAELKEFVTGNPYTSEINLEPSDEFLVVACDGVWDVLSDNVCCKYIQSKLAQGVTDPDVIAEDLVDLAITEGSADNISVIVVLFHFKK